MPKVKLLGGVHPDEWEALQFVHSLVSDPIPNVSPGIANPRAATRRQRQADKNMAFCFPGDPRSADYESGRATQIVAVARNFAVTIDLHNINGQGANTAQIDFERGVSAEVLGFLGAIGIESLIETRYGGIMRHIHNAVVIETLRGPGGIDPMTFRRALFRLANDPDTPRARATDFRWLKLVDYSPHKNRVGPDCLADAPGLQAFEPLPAALAARIMDTPPSGLSLMGWLDEPNERGYWTDLVVPAPVPNDLLWRVNQRPSRSS